MSATDSDYADYLGPHTEDDRSDAVRDADSLYAMVEAQAAQDRSGFDAWVDQMEEDRRGEAI